LCNTFSSSNVEASFSSCSLPLISSTTCIFRYNELLSGWKTRKALVVKEGSKHLVHMVDIIRPAVRLCVCVCAAIPNSCNTRVACLGYDASL
jgi:hypothetical protein